jgi:hypothetical protein
MTNPELSKLIEQWGCDLAKQEKIESLRNAFISCQLNADVNELVNKNILFLNDNPKLWIFPRDARRRINRLRRETIKSWNLYLN